MSVDDLTDSLGETVNTELSKMTAIFIALLAALLAICDMGGANAEKAAVENNIAASNTWAFFQAKNIRKTSYELAADDLEVLLVSRDDLSQAARGDIENKIAKYRAKAARYESEPETGEGKKELLKKGKALEAARDYAMRQDPYFDYSAALYQIAIVLASVSILAGSVFMLAFSIMMGVVATALMFNGFYLWANLPFLS